MSELVTEESLGYGFVAVSYNGSVLLVLHEERGYFNANQLSIRAGMNVDIFRSSLDLTMVVRNYPKENLYTVRKGWPFGGQYFHPAILLDFAHWISPDAFAVVAIIVGEVYRTTRSMPSPNLLTYGEQPSCERDTVDPSRWCIKYDNELEFIVDDRGFCDATRLYQHIDPDPAEGSIDSQRRSVVKRFIAYLRIKGQFTDGDQFCHPLLFLLLAQRCDMNSYVRYVRVILISSGDDILDARFRQACQQLQPLIPGIQSYKEEADQLRRELASTSASLVNQLRSQMALVDRELASARASLEKAQELIADSRRT